MKPIEQENENGDFDESFQDLSSRLEKIPIESVIEVSHKLGCSQEFARVVYLLSTNYEIDHKLILEDLSNELHRLKTVGYEIPDVETYLYNFALLEVKWIAYFRGTFPAILLEEAKKIQPYFTKLTKVKGIDLITLCTQLMMERQYIAANKIIPVIEKWKEEHRESNDFDAGIRVAAGLLNTFLNEKLIYDLNLIKKKLFDQIKLIGEVLSNSEQSNWIFRSIIEVEILYEDLSQEIKVCTNRGIADILLFLAINEFEKNIGEFSNEEDINRMIMRFQLESTIGLSEASPIATLEYDLLHLSFKDPSAKPKLAEQMILKAWKASRLANKPIDIGREILPILIDYCNAPPAFLSKIPAHYDFIIENYNKDKIRLNRALERMKKEEQLSEKEIQEAIILDYLIQFTKNYVIGLKHPDIKELDIPERAEELDLLKEEKHLVDMIDAAIRRGIRTKNRQEAVNILNNQISSMYSRFLDIVKEEVTVGESVIYGIFNMHNISISRQEARELILRHFHRMMISAGSSGKKRIDSAVQMAIKIEIEEKIINKET